MYENLNKIEIFFKIKLPKMQYFSKFVTFSPTFSPLLGSNDSFFQAKTGTRLYHNLPHTWIANFQLFLSPCNHVKSIFRAIFATRILCIYVFCQIFSKYVSIIIRTKRLGIDRNWSGMV